MNTNSTLDQLFQLVDDFNTKIAANAKPYFDFPKYNIRKVDDHYVVEMALAGFDKSELSVKASQGVVEIQGTPSRGVEHPSNLLFKGIAMKPFKVRMAIPYGATVGGVSFTNGILSFEFGDSATAAKELPIN